LLKRTASARLIEAIRNVYVGSSPVTPELARRLVRYFSRLGDHDSSLSHLTPEERDFLDQLANGSDHKEIADRMKISIDTSLPDGSSAPPIRVLKTEPNPVTPAALGLREQRVRSAITNSAFPAFH